LSPSEKFYTFAYRTNPPVTPKEISREEKKAEAKRLYLLKWSMQKIADHLGVSKGTVWNFLHEDDGEEDGPAM